MIFESRTKLIFAVCLSSLAGFNDAVGFRTLGGFFVSFMSGNSTRLAVGLSEQGWVLAALVPLALIVLFTLGVMLGSAIRIKTPQRKETAVLAFVSLALFAAAILGLCAQSAAAIIFMVMAMGASNNIFVKEGEVSVGLTYMTGTLVKLGQRLAGRLLNESKKPWFAYFALWFGLVSGAVIGSFSYTWFDLNCLWIAAFFSAALLLASVRSFTESPAA